MPLKDYPLKERIFGNFVVSVIMGLGSVFGLVVLNVIGVKIPIQPTSYFIIPSYFCLLCVFTELKVRKEHKNECIEHS